MIHDLVQQNTSVMIFVNENENGEKQESNEFVNEN